MIILEKPVSREQLKKMAAEMFGDLVKAVVDVDRELVALDAELHSDLEALLLEKGAKQASLWGINLYPEIEDDDFLEFDSMINLRPSQNNMSRGVDDPQVQQRIRDLINKWVIQ